MRLVNYFVTLVAYILLSAACNRAEELPSSALLDDCADDLGDADSDGICSSGDNCPTVANPEQQDHDQDGIGDACDDAEDDCSLNGGDVDDDGACNDWDNCPAIANSDQRDSDADGSGDACDAVDDSDPCATLGGDTDEDSVCQAFDNCPDFANADQLDSDGDGIGDTCDDEQDDCYSQAGDADSDGVCGTWDNCVLVPNPDQANADGDGLGDACDPVDGSDVCATLGGDEDGDHVCQSLDNCPKVSNAGQADADGDKVGDACDATPNLCDDHGDDDDKDGVCGDFDNCKEVNNHGQVDLDHDGIGDICDPEVETGDYIGPCAGVGGDEDSDDWCAINDNCPSTHNTTQSDVDSDGVGDTCDTEECNGIDNNGDGVPDDGFDDGDSDGQADCVDPCPFVPNADEDSDALIDCIDACPQDPDNDADGDSLCANNDNCPLVYNNYGSSAQADNDGDGLGNGCDTEECDGIDNDGDSTTDEGMANADSDSLCDAEDACPLDAHNDYDHDGVCEPTDNCPYLSNDDQGDEDSDGWGNVCDVDSHESCATLATQYAPADEPLPTTLAVKDVVADPTQEFLYLAVGASDTTWPNTVLAVDPVEREVVWSLPIGTDPNLLSISSDGSLLYVGLWGSGTVRVVDLRARRGCHAFPVGLDTRYGALRAGDMEVLPGQAEVVVVSLRRIGVSPDFAGVVVFDNGVQRRVGTPGHTGARMITAAHDSLIYGYNNSSSDFSFIKLKVDEHGIHQEWYYSELVSGFSVDIAFIDDRVYATNGTVLNPEIPTLIGTTGCAGPVTANAASAEIFCASSASQLRVYDYGLLYLERSIPLSGLSGTPTKLISWGESGLAVTTSSNIAFVQNAEAQ